jgi:hypothetical protein
MAAMEEGKPAERIKQNCMKTAEDEIVKIECSTQGAKQRFCN